MNSIWRSLPKGWEEEGEGRWVIEKGFVHTGIVESKKGSVLRKLNRSGMDVLYLLHWLAALYKRCRLTTVWPDWAIFGLCAIFQSLWQQLFVQNRQHFEALFVKVSKSFLSLVKIIFGNFYRHWATFYWSRWLTTTQPLKWTPKQADTEKSQSQMPLSPMATHHHVLVSKVVLLLIL